MMKLACVYDVVHPYVVGGVQKRSWEIARRLVKKGHQVTLFGPKYWKGNDVMYREGVRFWGVCPPQPLFIEGRRSIKEAIYFACRVLPPLMKERFDVLEVANFPYFPCFSAELCSLARRSRLVITWHEVWDDYWYEYLGKKGAFGKAVERLVARLPQKAIVISPHTKTGLERLGRKTADIVACGVDIAAIESAAQWPKSNGIIFAGRLAQEKNVIQLLKAVGILKERGHDMSCIIIGEGPDKVLLQREAHEMGIDTNVRFLGRVESDADVYSYMKSSRVMVHPSTREGFSHVVLEANACGIPVVTVNHPQNAAQELIMEGRNGFICDLSGADMADKVQQALSAEGWENRCKEFAAAYDWDNIAESAELAYLGALD
jgi:glycosyltransferase involved in cell wall biosynthesis